VKRAPKTHTELSSVVTDKLKEAARQLCVERGLPAIPGLHRLTRADVIARIDEIDGGERRVIELANEAERAKFEEKEAERRAVPEDEEAYARPKDDERVVMVGTFCYNCGFRYYDTAQQPANFCASCGSKRPRKE
jgi:hypothetical protein